MSKSALTPALPAAKKPANDPAPVETPAAAESQAGPQGAPKKGASRQGLKHIGGYLDEATVEKVALLRARLKLDNSQLLQLAIEELYSDCRAKRAFGTI